MNRLKVLGTTASVAKGMVGSGDRAIHRRPLPGGSNNNDNNNNDNNNNNSNMLNYSTSNSNSSNSKYSNTSNTSNNDNNKRAQRWARLSAMSERDYFKRLPKACSPEELPGGSEADKHARAKMSR